MGSLKLLTSSRHGMPRSLDGSENLQLTVKGPSAEDLQLGDCIAAGGPGKAQESYGSRGLAKRRIETRMHVLLSLGGRSASGEEGRQGRYHSRAKSAERGDLLAANAPARPTVLTSQSRRQEDPPLAFAAVD